jgi:ABC-type phosphate transport system substrate-binding protein
VVNNNITMWSNKHIKALNTKDVADAQPILVVTQSIASATTQIFTAALSSKVPEYSAKVRARDHQCNLECCSH